VQRVLFQNPAIKQSDRIRTPSTPAFAAAGMLRSTWPHFLFGLLIALNVVRTLRHEMWRDEIQTFMLAAESSTPLELF